MGLLYGIATFRSVPAGQVAKIKTKRFQAKFGLRGEFDDLGVSHYHHHPWLLLQINIEP